MATLTATTTCVYSTPVTYQNIAPTLPTHAFYFKNQTCTTVDNATTTPLASSTVGFNPLIASSTNATTSDMKIYAYMSAGEVLTNLLLFVLIIMALIYFVVKSLNRINTKKTYLQYGGGDVEMREDI